MRARHSPLQPPTHSSLPWPNSLHCILVLPSSPLFSNPTYQLLRSLLAALLLRSPFKFRTINESRRAPSERPSRRLQHPPFACLSYYSFTRSILTRCDARSLPELVPIPRQARRAKVDRPRRRSSPEFGPYQPPRDGQSRPQFCHRLSPAPFTQLVAVIPRWITSHPPNGNRRDVH